MFYSLSECQGVCERARVKRRCRQRPEVGTDCNNKSTVQFYYDKHCQCCQRFTYLGCGGNRNRFATQGRCNKKCTISPAQPTAKSQPALCYTHSAYGSCTEQLTRYFYSKHLKRCIPFTYSGCGGNANRFDNLNMCKQTCEHHNKKGSGSRSTSQLPPTRTTQTTTTPTTTTPIPSQCKGAPDRGHCMFDINRFYYDNEFRKCRLFVWGGCGGNSNRFLNRRQCTSKCMNR